MSQTAEYQPEFYKLPYPSHCPGCKSKLVVRQPHLLCQNEQCPERVKGRLESMANRSHLDIQTLGESVAVALVDHGYVRNLADVWKLNETRVANLPFGKGVYGQKRASTLIKNIGASIKHPWPVVLHALAAGTGLGHDQAAQIARIYSLHDLIGVMHPVALKLALKNLDGVGEQTANDFVTWLNANADWLYEFVENGWLQTQYQATETGPQPLEGQQFILTGSFSERSARSMYEKQLEALGAKIGSKPSKKTTEVIAGTSGAAQDKLDLATKLGKTIRDEAWLVDFLEGVK